MSFTKLLLRVLLALALAMNVAAAKELLAPHDDTHTGYHGKDMSQADSAHGEQGHHGDDSHPNKNVAKTQNSHCAVCASALPVADDSSFHASMGAVIVPEMVQAWSTLDFPPPLRPPMRRA